MSRTKVKITQAGGKYGVFDCPTCSSEAYFKFTASMGFCNTCESTFAYTGGLHMRDVNKPEQSTHIIELEIET